LRKRPPALRRAAKACCGVAVGEGNETRVDRCLVIGQHSVAPVGHARCGISVPTCLSMASRSAFFGNVFSIQPCMKSLTYSFSFACREVSPRTPSTNRFQYAAGANLGRRSPSPFFAAKSKHAYTNAMLTALAYP